MLYNIIEKPFVTCKYDLESVVWEMKKNGRSFPWLLRKTAAISEV